jgi:hypothetical protein
MDWTRVTIAVLKYNILLNLSQRRPRSIFYRELLAMYSLINICASSPVDCSRNIDQTVLEALCRRLQVVNELHYLLNTL